VSSKERVFISGVAGFLGSHLADAFLAEGWEVAGIDNLVGGYLDNVPAGVSFVRADCNDLPRVRALMEGASVVYHCAATAYEGLSVFSPHFVTQNVVTATTGMISAAVANRVRRFVHCSSMARYGANPVPFTEDQTPRPQDPYGIGKLAAEGLVRNLAEVHGVEWVVAVPHNIIGPRQKYDDPYRNVAAIFAVTGPGAGRRRWSTWSTGWTSRVLEVMNNSSALWSTEMGNERSSTSHHSMTKSRVIPARQPSCTGGVNT